VPQRRELHVEQIHHVPRGFQAAVAGESQRGNTEACRLHLLSVHQKELRDDRWVFGRDRSAQGEPRRAHRLFRLFGEHASHSVVERRIDTEGDEIGGLPSRLEVQTVVSESIGTLRSLPFGAEGREPLDVLGGSDLCP
jgi:hypothetical protein